ncbi:MAG TPA: hypothetical protein ENL09_05460 [Bacteroidetes bacterium]|nr:hypothetical protein [Bacteroidota bacterium]
MKAAFYEEFCGPITIQQLPDPVPTKRGVVIRVEATGLCRSDWHGWMGHDPDITNGGAHVSIDALGSHETCFNSISSLRKQGKHIQIGLMVAEEKNPPIPMEKVIANELEILGSHGIQAWEYGRMLGMIEKGKLHPEKLIRKTISLEEAPTELVNMNSFKETGITVINKL